MAQPADLFAAYGNQRMGDTSEKIQRLGQSVHQLVQSSHRSDEHLAQMEASCEHLSEQLAAVDGFILGRGNLKRRKAGAEAAFA